MSKIQEIADGWKNVIKHELGYSSEEDVNIFDSRRQICNACAYRDVEKDKCTKCGCPLVAKTKSLKTLCPEGYWVK
jgi:ribosomal protein L37E